MARMIAHADIREVIQNLHDNNSLSTGERDRLYADLGVTHEHGEIDHHKLADFTKNFHETHREHFNEFTRGKILQQLKPMLDKHYGEASHEHFEGKKAA